MLKSNNIYWRLSHLHSVEAWRVVGVSELLPAAGEDLVDGEAAEVVPPQEPVQHVVQHARGAALANTFTPSLFSLPKKNQINLIGVSSYGSYQSKWLSWCPGRAS